MIDRLLILILFLIGFWGIIAKRNILKKIFSLTILNSTVVILFVLEGSRIGNRSPILGTDISNVVDPVPQALMLTAIVIGVCITALALALAYRLYIISGSFNIDIIRRYIRNHHDTLPDSGDNSGSSPGDNGTSPSEDTPSKDNSGDSPADSGNSSQGDRS